MRKLPLIIAFGFVIAFLFFGHYGDLMRRSGQGQGARLHAGAVLVHSAIHHDVSPPLVAIQVSSEGIELADCQGAGCGTSPGWMADDSYDEQEKPPDEPIPPPIP